MQSPKPPRKLVFVEAEKAATAAALGSGDVGPFLNQPNLLGVLSEKSLTQPDSYPISLNTVTIGCNQKSNRDPIMDLDEDAVWDTLEELRNQAGHAGSSLEDVFLELVARENEAA